MYPKSKKEFYAFIRKNPHVFISIYENQPAKAWYTRFDQDNQSWGNGLFWQNLGFTQQENEEFALTCRLHADDLENLKHLLATKTTERLFVVELRFRHQEGHYMASQWQVFKDEGPAGALLAVSLKGPGTGYQNLVAGVELFQDFINLGSTLCCVTDLQGNVMYLNQPWQHVLGYPLQELHTIQLSEFIHPNDFAHSREALKQLWHGKPVVNYVNKILCKDGTYKTLSWSAMVKHGFIYASANDISAEKKASEKLAANEELFKGIADNLPGMIIRLVKAGNEEERIDFISRGIETLLGIPMADAIANPKMLLGRFFEEDMPALRQSLRQASETCSFWQHEWRAFGPKGNKIWLSGQCTPKQLPDGSIQYDAILLDITERKKVEEDLHLSEKKFRFLTEATSEMICQHKPDGTCVYLSPSVEKLTGYKAHELEGQTPYSYFHPEDLEHIRMHSHQIVLNGQSVSSIEYRMRRKDGQYVWFDTHTDPVLGASGEVVSLITRTRDISAKKRGEEQLERIMNQLNEEKQQLESIIAQIPAGFILAEAPSGKIIKYNKQAERILGHPLFPFTTLASYGHWEAFTLEGPPLAEEEYPVSKVMATARKVENMEYQYKKSDGQLVTLLSNAAPLFDENQNLTAVVNIFTDITFIKEAERALMDKNKHLIEIEQELRASEEELTTYIMELNSSKDKLEAQRKALKNSEKEARALARQYQSILDSQAVYVLKTDAQGRYTYVNEYFRNRFGYKGYLIGQSALESVVPEDRDTCFQTVEKCFIKPGISHEVILRKPDKNGTIKGGKWEFKGVVDEHGHVGEVLCVGFDITEQLENIEQAQYLLEMTQQQNERLIEYTNITSHNLRAPVARLLGLCDLLEITPQNPEYISLIRQSAKKLDETIRLMNDLLDIEHEGSKLKKTEVNLYHVVRQSFEQLIAHGHSDAALDLKMPIDQQVYVVPAYLDSIVYNLLSNAIKYRKNHEMAKVTVSCTTNDDFLVMEVTDNGIGIDLEKYGSKLFKMKSRLNTNLEGKGIGLFFTKQQIEAMGGKIEVFSQPGIGTTFKAHFPRVSQSATPS